MTLTLANCIILNTQMSCSDAEKVHYIEYDYKFIAVLFPSHLFAYKELFVFFFKYAAKSFDRVQWAAMTTFQG